MKYIMIVFMFLCVPAIARAEVSITEIAWMGTTESQFGEWIELHNSGSEPVDLNGWKMYSDGGEQVLFSLTRSIPANEYLLIERTTASMLDPVPGIDGESGSFGGGGLSNIGEFLILKDADGNTVQSLDYASGWPAGDTTTKDTMQWNGSSWVTLSGTPNDSASDDTETEDEEETDEEVSKSTALKKQKAVAPHIVIVLPEIIYKGVPQTYDAHVALVDEVKGEQTWKDGLYVWNMGDGTIVKTEGSTPHSHTYRYPGTYTIAVAHYVHSNNAVPLLKQMKVVKIQIPEIEIEYIDEGKALRLRNVIDKAIDLTDWKIVCGTKTVLVPEMTILAPRAVITISSSILGLSDMTDCKLLAPDDSLIAES